MRKIEHIFVAFSEKLNFNCTGGKKPGAHKWAWPNYLTCTKLR
jgi:hypothetical protein